jgi:hypothetical protein
MKPVDLIRTIEIKDRSGRVVGTKEVVTYPGLLSKAHEEGLVRVSTELVQVPTDENGRTAIAKATVETAKGKFEGIGDAAPDSVTAFLVPHLIRMAETRAKARALRDAVNIGIVSFEELDGDGPELERADLGSGATNRPVRSDRPSAPREPRPPETRGNGAEIPMSEAQRRYLFRILGGQGIAGEDAHAYLKDFLGVASLKDVTRQQATRAIDRLLKREADGVSHGTA